jgi:hypothetical protein
MSTIRGLKDWVAICRAPFYKKLGLGVSIAHIDYSKDNGFVDKWSNAADSADVSAFRVTALDQLQALSTLNFSSIVPGSEVSGSLISNDLRWTIASGMLTSVVVLSDVGTLVFAEAHNKAVGDIIVISGATTDTDLNATYTVASIPSATTLTVATSSVSDGTYTDAGIVVTAWQAFSTPGACGIKLLCSNRSATGNFAVLRLRARSDIATPTWNQNTIALDAEASARIADYGELLGASSYTNDNGFAQTRGSHWANAIKACTNCSGVSAGSRYALVVSDYSSTKAATAQYLARYDKPSGACAIDGVFAMGNCDQFSYLFNFEITGGYLSESDTKIAVNTASGAKYIPLSDATNALLPTARISFNSMATPVAGSGSTAGSLLTAGTAGTWLAHSYAGACGIKLLLSNTCNTGMFSSLRVRARADNTTTTGDGGSSIGVSMAGDFSASANAHDFGSLFALNAVAQPNAFNQTTDATNIVCAVLSRIDATGTSVGRRWVNWIDSHAESKADASDYMFRISHNGTVPNDGCFTFYNGGRMPVLFNFEDAAGFLTDSDASKTTPAGALKVTTPAGEKYIVLYT